ncbi:LLM class flavin-dependent oxidoreductase [Kineosporia sp. NBRC 101731]|uniref:LLM class flavin-dependent oxidoreductase n=1 Tax=Kineosporia sp. NBRC 101731 TaxID=3032199 RepID=UPI0024A17AED|nr:LLM class flavin-dependent oxidoreductase [Kineosporia sp. NBRC 101731]GLY30977.1 luciferase [Kineosporia sp. NBRC 101731]
MRIETGVFLPVGQGGWIPSTNSPAIPATYAYNREVTVLGEELGLDIALSMAKWRGYGGSTGHWDHTLESLTTMAGLAEATSRIKIWATVHTMIWHPAVVAKMAATLDQISGGRFGLNLVGGSNPADQGQMGLWRELGHAQRYDLVEEWLAVAKALWTQDRVDHEGEFYTLKDCMSYPKPAVMPHVICAGTSDRGFRFTIEHTDGVLISGQNHDDAIAVGRRAKALATELGRTTKTYGLFVFVPGATDTEARDRVHHFNEGVDTEALVTQAGEYAKDTKANTRVRTMQEWAASAKAVGDGALVGSPDTIARDLGRIVTQGELDGVVIIVPDFLDDLRTVATQALPRLADQGITCGVGA